MHLMRLAAPIVPFCAGASLPLNNDPSIAFLNTSAPSTSGAVVQKDYPPYDIPGTNPPLQLRFGPPQVLVSVQLIAPLLNKALVDLGKMGPNDKVPPHPYEGRAFVWQADPFEFFIQNVSRGTDFTVAIAIKIVRGYSMWLDQQKDQVGLSVNQVFKGNLIYAKIALLPQRYAGTDSEAS